MTDQPVYVNGKLYGRGPVEELLRLQQECDTADLYVWPRNKARWTIDGQIWFHVGKMPSRWVRFWQRKLLGIRWEWL